MSNRGVEVEVSCDVLRWARTQSGYSEEDVALKLNVDPKIIFAWELKDTNIRFSQIRAMAAFFKRPEATLLLSKPPSSDPLPPDFRGSNKKGKFFSPQTLLSIRRARRLQKILKLLLNNLKKKSAVDLSIVSTTDNPEIVANNQRTRMLQLHSGKIPTFKDAYDSFNFWKYSLELNNIFILNMKMPSEDARGFSFATDTPYIIVLNPSEPPTARNFTMFHEYAHLLLKSSGVCTPSFGDSLAKQEENSSAIESWCNKFSASFLMPKEIVVNAYKEREQDGLDRILPRLAMSFGVSRHAILLRLYNLDLISEKDFREEYAIVQSQVQLQLSKKAKTKTEIKISSSIKCINEKGTKVVSLVLENLDSNLISPNEFSDFLSLKIQNIDQVRELAARREYHVR